MYVKRIRLKNVRGFGEVDLDLSRPDGSFAGWTVLAGRNGSGKTTFLRALALVMTGTRGAGILCESFANWIRVGKARAEIDAEVEVSPSDYAAKQGRLSPDSFSLVWTTTRDSLEPILTTRTKERLPLDPSVWRVKPRGWFLAEIGRAHV